MTTPTAAPVKLGRAGHGLNRMYQPNPLYPNVVLRCACGFTVASEDGALCEAGMLQHLRVLPNHLGQH